MNRAVGFDFVHVVLHYQLDSRRSGFADCEDVDWEWFYGLAGVFGSSRFGTGIRDLVVLHAVSGKDTHRHSFIHKIRRS